MRILVHAVGVLLLLPLAARAEGDMVLAEWIADDWFPTRCLDGSSSNRRVIPNVSLRRDDVIHVVGVPEGGETAALDYVELTKR
jgi:hypothetical protein